jgi:hypothetical protein
MRHEATATCLSWIPPTAVQGVFSLPFGLGIAHYDQPPPDELADVGALLDADAIRFANQIHAWIEVEGGRITSHGMSGRGRLGRTTVRLRSHGLTFAGVALPELTPPPRVLPNQVVFTQTAGGHTGAPVPRRITQPPFWRLAAPLAWTTVTLSLHADGTSTAWLAAASPFPRHYLYDSAGRLTHKSALIRYKDWIRRSGRGDNPWTGGGTPVPVTAVRGPAERSLGNGSPGSSQRRTGTAPTVALVHSAISESPCSPAM